jgi:hypothetical protein
LPSRREAARKGEVLGLTNSLRAAIDAAPGEKITVRAGAPPRRLVVAAGLISLLLAAALCQSLLTHHLSSAEPGASFAAAHSLPASSAGLSSLPLAAQAPVSQALGAENPGYRIGASRDGLTAANPRQRLLERFARTGISVQAGST